MTLSWPGIKQPFRLPTIHNPNATRPTKQKSNQSRPSLRSHPLTLAHPLRTALLRPTALHLLHREIPHISTGHGVAALRMALLATEAEPLVLLLALGVRALAAFASILFAGVVDLDVEEAFCVICRAGGVVFAFWLVSELYINAGNGRGNSLFFSASILSNVSLFSFCLCCNLATWTCFPNFFKSRCLRASADAFFAAASSNSFFLIRPICSSVLTISAK